MSMPIERFNQAVVRTFQAFAEHDQECFEEAIFDAKLAVLWKDKEAVVENKAAVFALLDEARETFPRLRALHCLTEGAVALVAREAEHQRKPELPPEIKT